MSKYRSYLALGLVALGCATGQLSAAEVALQWNPTTRNVDGSIPRDLTGYRVYWGAASQAYTAATNVGNVTQATISGLADGSTSYLAVTTLNALGRESPFSTELRWTAPLPVAPVIVSQPAGVTVTAGATAQFVAQASGVPAPGAQWRKNGVVIAGATNFVYVTPPTVLADNGAQFTCLAQSSAGSALSQTAVLTVLVPNLYPPKWAAVANQSVVLGSSLAFVVAATDADGPAPALSASLKPAAATFVDQGNGSGTLAWTPMLTSDVGDHSVQFAASDGLHNVTTSIVIHVSAPVSTNTTAGSVTLLWNAPTRNLSGSTLRDLAGYRIYQGAASGAYTTWRDVGNVTQATVTGLTAQTTVYLAVVSYNARGTLSPFSSELSYTAPASVQTALKTQLAPQPLATAAPTSATTPATTSPVVSKRLVSMDFDGDGRSDPALCRQADGRILFHTSASNELFTTSQGDTNWLACAADFDGDGRTDPAWFVPASGEWIILCSSQDYAEVSPRPVFGGTDDLPIPADFDGSGCADLAVFSMSHGTISYRPVHTNDVLVTPIGDPAWIPCAADFDGDGRADPAWFVPATGVWHILESSHGYAERTPAPVLGNVDCLPVPADFDGDGKADLAVFNKTTGKITVLESGVGRQWTTVAGSSGFMPAVGDYDGDGRADCAWRRPATRDLLVVLTGSSTKPGQGVQKVLGPLGEKEDWPLPTPVLGW